MKTWILYVICSALALGLYDFCKKQAVRENSTLPVLFLATFCGSAFYLLLSLCTGRLADAWQCTPRQYLLIWVKALIVGGSWLCAYRALTTLPLSIAAPIRATSPLWVLIGATCLYREIPSLGEGIGMILVLIGYYFFTLLGHREGFAFRNSPEMRLVILGTLLGATSGLYDKFLLNTLAIPAATVQVHFSVNLVVLFGIAWLVRRATVPVKPAQWRWSIPATGVLLILADWCYFHAVSLPGVPISQVALVRRCSCIVTFLLSAYVLKERNIRAKAVALIFILAGVALMGLY